MRFRSGGLAQLETRGGVSLPGLHCVSLSDRKELGGYGCSASCRGITKVGRRRTIMDLGWGIRAITPTRFRGGPSTHTSHKERQVTESSFRGAGLPLKVCDPGASPTAIPLSRQRPLGESQSPVGSHHPGRGARVLPSEPCGVSFRRASLSYSTHLLAREHSLSRRARVFPQHSGPSHLLGSEL